MTAAKGKENQKSQSLAGSESPIQQVQGTRSVHDLNEAEQTALNSLLMTSEEIDNELVRLYQEHYSKEHTVTEGIKTYQEFIDFNKKQWFPADEVRKAIKYCEKKHGGRYNKLKERLGL